MDVARATGRFPAFVHGIDDLDVLYEVASLVKDSGNRVYRVIEGGASGVFESLRQAWGVPAHDIIGKPGWKTMEYLWPDGSTTIVTLRRPTTDNNLPTLEIRGPFGPSKFIS